MSVFSDFFKRPSVHYEFPYTAAWGECMHVSFQKQWNCPRGWQLWTMWAACSAVVLACCCYKHFISFCVEQPVRKEGFICKRNKFRASDIRLWQKLTECFELLSAWFPKHTKTLKCFIFNHDMCSDQLTGLLVTSVQVLIYINIYLKHFTFQQSSVNGNRAM